jgi:thiol-disulfide isomerase/thioredoxin
MSYFNSPNVVYLEKDDFDNGRLIIPGTVIVMFQGNFCGYCTRLKPIYQQIADENTSNIIFATAQTDSVEQSEQCFSNSAFVSQILGKSLQGVPVLIKFVNGFPQSEYGGDRSSSDLRRWIYT